MMEEGQPEEKKITQRDLTNILYSSKLKDAQFTIDRKLASSGKDHRLEVIRTEPDSSNAKTCAALEIQRLFRGYHLRCRIFSVLKPKASHAVIHTTSRPVLTERCEDFADEKDKNRAQQRLQRKHETLINDLWDKGTPEENLPTFEKFCAMQVQTWWQELMVKWKKVKGPEEPPAPSPPPPINMDEMEAAKKIQRAWRRHIDVQVYHYYKDLINFKSSGDPKLMLRCINPNEAKLLDSASGIHVKFRLAGVKFPPNIYYKIYTHRTIIDMCANAPRDYTKQDTKRKDMKEVHNKTKKDKGPKEIDTTDWYKRIENNGWRLVSDRILNHATNDPIAFESANKTIDFHHDKLQRKQDVEKKKRNKKISWMQKMYKDGMLKAKSGDEETARLIEGAAGGMVAAVDQAGPDALEDWEVDELLDWTTSLNFEDYTSSWKEIATSATSERGVEEKLNLLAETVDPFEFSISTALSHMDFHPQYEHTSMSHYEPMSIPT